MTVEFSGGQQEEVSRFSVSTTSEITIHLAQKHGNRFIVIKEEGPTAAPRAGQSIEIPVALLPELKRAIAALEKDAGGGEEYSESDEADSSHRSPNFAHHSEEEFARILDFYHITWLYEPRTFAIEWDEDGNVVKSFTPDFYLPEHDLYIELTTQKQALVTRKNRKVRLLKEIYPDVNIKILYASDYRKLIEKFAGSGAWQEGAFGGKS